jgi:hypothetical protein
MALGRSVISSDAASLPEACGEAALYGKTSHRYYPCYGGLAKRGSDDDVKGIAVSAATGNVYVAYRTRSGIGMVYCLSVHVHAAIIRRFDLTNV